MGNRLTRSADHTPEIGAATKNRQSKLAASKRLLLTSTVATVVASIGIRLAQAQPPQLLPELRQFRDIDDALSHIRIEMASAKSLSEQNTQRAKRNFGTKYEIMTELEVRYIEAKQSADTLLETIKNGLRNNGAINLISVRLVNFGENVSKYNIYVASLYGESAPQTPEYEEPSGRMAYGPVLTAIGTILVNAIVKFWGEYRTQQRADEDALSREIDALRWRNFGDL